MSFICWGMFIFFIAETALAGAAVIPAWKNQNEEDVKYLKIVAEFVRLLIKEFFYGKLRAKDRNIYIFQVCQRHSKF